MGVPSEAGASRKTTVAEATVNMLKSACGPGCLSLAFAVAKAGWAPSPVLIVLLQCCCVYNMWLLTRLKRQQSADTAEPAVRTYGDVAARVYGARGRALVDAFVSLQQLGICCVYFGFVSSNIMAVLLSFGAVAAEAHWGLVQLMLAAFLVLAPLALIRHWKKLAPLSLVANGCILSGIAVAIGFVLPLLVADGPAPHLAAVPAGAWLHGLPLLYGNVIYSFELVCNVRTNPLPCQCHDCPLSIAGSSAVLG